MILTEHPAADTIRRFESLMCELSTRFIEAPADGVGSLIRAALRDVCEVLGLDRSTVWQQADQAGPLLLTHFYQPPDVPLPPDGADARELFPWLCRRVRLGEVTAVEDIDDLPAEAGRDKATFDRYHTKSTVVVPMRIGGEVNGALSFAVVREYRDWPPEVVHKLQLLAQIFATALSRERCDRALRDSESRLRRASEEWRVTFDAIGDPVMLLDADRRLVRANAATTAALEAGDEQVVGQHCYSLFHGSAGQAQGCPFATALATGEPHECEIPDERHGTCRQYSVYPLPAGSIDGVSAICVARDITARKQAEENLRGTLDELHRLRDQLHQQNVILQREVKTLSRHSRLIGKSAALQGVLSLVEQVAPTTATVLLLGETGTGKELIASEIHELSPRRERLMVRVNCSAIPVTLIESELFGREKGAYTGALSRQIGRFEMANGSTLFLDEIGELPLEIQVKLLRVLQERQIERLGSTKPIPVDVRIVAATNRDLDELVREGKFREDLYYRLHVFPITLPPLRERREDIPALVSALVSEFGAAFGKNIESIARESMEALQHYRWPGNIRELRNAIERAMIVADGPKLRVDPPGRLAGPSALDFSAKAVERDHILRVLEITSGRIRGKDGAADILKLKPTTLESRMARLGIPARSGRPAPK